MTVAAFTLFAAAVVVMVLVHRATQRRLERVLLEQQKEATELFKARDEAMYKQSKVFVRSLAQTERAAKKMIDEVRNAHEDYESLRKQTTALLTDERIRSLLRSYEAG